MNKVYLIEYQGRCDENGIPVGHAPKVISEYYNFIKDYCDVTVLAPKTFSNVLSDSGIDNTVILPRHIVMKGQTPFIEKITNKLGMFKNIKEAIKLADKDGDVNLWFFNVEYYIMLYFFLHKKPKHKVTLTMFIDGYHAGENASIKNKIINGIKQKIFESAQKKFDLIISTGEKFKYKNCKNEFIPDYYYIDEIYDKYNDVNKSDYAVCLGTMGRGKQLRELVDTFNRIRYKLNISGRFYDKELFKELKAAANENITINDTYLSNEEYLKLLSEAKYTVLPYPENCYSHQTSGVMQEAIFLKTIPVTYKSILDGNCCPGVGFESWDKLTTDMLDNNEDIVDELTKLIDTIFNKENVIAKYEMIFDCSK